MTAAWQGSGVVQRTKAVLTADGHEPFEHVTVGPSYDLKGCTEFAVQVWLLAHPAGRYAKNISVRFERWDDEAGDWQPVMAEEADQ